MLDWLAVEFIASGWDVKHMVKLLVMTDAYRRSSVATIEPEQSDPENRYFARQSRWRLDAEFVSATTIGIDRSVVHPMITHHQDTFAWKPSSVLSA